MSGADVDLAKRYTEFNLALAAMKASGKKRDKTVDAARGFAYEIKKQLEAKGYEVPPVAWE